MNQELINLTIKYRNACFDQMKKEAHKGINRVIAIVRDWARKWRKEAILIDENIKDDGFEKLIKKRLLELDLPKEIKRAVKYL